MTDYRTETEKNLSTVIEQVMIISKHLLQLQEAVIEVSKRLVRVESLPLIQHESDKDANTDELTHVRRTLAVLLHKPLDQVDIIADMETIAQQLEMYSIDAGMAETKQIQQRRVISRDNL